MRVDIGLLILRIFVGVALARHGLGKTDIGRFAAKFNLSPLVAAAVARTQVVAGIMLAAGVLTMVAALGIAATMAGAIVKCRERGEPFIDPEHHSWESAGFYLASAVALALMGPGAYSLDHILFR